MSLPVGRQVLTWWEKIDHFLRSLKRVVSSVKKILDSINFNESEFIENWIVEVRDSLFAMNEEKFNDLMNQIT